MAENPYQAYVDSIMADGVAEMAFIIGHKGDLYATNCPIQQMPVYEFDVLQEDDSTKKEVIDEKVNLVEALEN